jgi:hypothetical protein
MKIGTQNGIHYGKTPLRTDTSTKEVKKEIQRRKGFEKIVIDEHSTVMK